MNPKLWLLGRVVTVGAGVLVEQVTRPVASTVGEVPRDAVAIDADWLTAVLCQKHPGARVTSFSSPGGSSGTSTRAALRVVYNAAGNVAQLPTELFAKTTTTFRQRLFLGAARVLDGETQFFTRLRGHAEIEAPQGYWGGFDGGSWRSYVLMEDIAATKGATFVEPTAPLARAEVEDLVGNLARLHGALWEHPAIAALKTPREHLHNIGSFVGVAARSEVGMERAKAEVPAALHGLGDRLWTGAERSLRLATDALPRTLLHGDPHVGQTYRTADGRMGLADWQLIQQGGWGYDYAYLLASACEPADRRAWEHDLMDLYLEELVKAGGTAPSRAAAWLIYRQQLIYPLVIWAATIGRAAYQPRMQPDDTCRVIIRRVAAAIDELDSLGALGL